MKVKYVILASKLLLTEPTKAVSFIEIVEELTVGGLPSEIPESANLRVDFTFVAAYEFDDAEESDDIVGVFRLETPNGEVTPMDVTLARSESWRARAVVQVPGIPYRGPGTYTFSVDFKGVVATWGMRLKVEDMEKVA